MIFSLLLHHHHLMGDRPTTSLSVDISKALGFFVNRGAPTALMHLCCVGLNVLHAASLWALRISTCRAREGVRREVKGN